MTIDKEFRDRVTRCLLQEFGTDENKQIADHDALASIQKIIDDLAVVKAGIIENDHIFNGTLYDNEGELRVKEDEALDDGEKLSIQWFVKGVKGKVPKAK